MLDRLLTRLFGDGFEKDWWMGLITQIFFVGLLFAVLFFVGAWYLGGQSVEHEGTINISAPPAAIFQQLADPNNRLKWQTDAVSIALKTTGELQAKSEFKVQLKRGGGEVTAIEEVMQAVPDEWLSYRTSASHLGRVTVFKLQQALDPETDLPIPGVTKLTYRSTEQIVDSSRIWAAFHRPDVKARVETELGKIKELAESAAGSAAAQ
jgi:uncharacterized protein YndB with AHSA1/START domain